MSHEHTRGSHHQEALTSDRTHLAKVTVSDFPRRGNLGDGDLVCVRLVSSHASVLRVDGHQVGTVELFLAGSA